MKFGQWVGLLAFLAALYIVWEIRQILLLFFVSVILAIALNRLVRALQRSGLKRGVAVAIAAAVFLFCFVGFIGLVVPPFVEQLQRFVTLVPAFLEELEDWAEWIQSRIPQQWTREIEIVDLLVQQAQPFVVGVFDNFFIIFSDALAVLLKLVLVFILTIMLLLNPQQYRHPFILLFPAFYRRRVNEILTECETDLVGWVIGTGLTMGFVTVLSSLGLLILRIPLVFANSLWAGFAELIPNVSWILAMLPPLTIALLVAPWKAIAVIGLYFFIQQLESYLIIPFVMKKQASLPPAITLLAQLVFASFFGFLGLLLALPLMVVTRIVLKEVLVKDVLNSWK